jgi:hypothetical protein
VPAMHACYRMGCFPATEVPCVWWGGGKRGAGGHRDRGHGHLQLQGCTWAVGRAHRCEGSQTGCRWPPLCCTGRCRWCFLRGLVLGGSGVLRNDQSGVRRKVEQLERCLGSVGVSLRAGVVALLPGMPHFGWFRPGEDCGGGGAVQGGDPGGGAGCGGAQRPAGGAQEAA